MIVANTTNLQFAERLKLAISAKGYRQSPTLIGKLFNEHFQGRYITPNTARNWILGKCMPRQDKLVCLAEMLGTSPEQLRFGRSSEKTLIAEFGEGQIAVTNVDQQFFKRYLTLSESQRLLMREVLVELKPKTVV